MTTTAAIDLPAPTAIHPAPRPTPGRARRPGSSTAPRQRHEPSALLLDAIRQGAARADDSAALVEAHDLMVAEGLLHLLVPESFGGAGATFTEWFDTALTIAHADPSAGWVMGQGAIQSAWVAAAGSDELAGAFFSRRQTLASTSAGGVTAERRGDHLLVRGARWAYTSGSTGAGFLGGMVRTTVPGGPPATQMVVVPAHQATIEPTWNTLGLRGTASHHIHFGDEVAIPVTHAFNWPQITIVRPSTMATALQHTLWAITVAAAAVNLGAARRSIDEAIAAAEHKQHRFDSVPVGRQPTFIRAIASLTGSVELAQAGLRSLLDDLWVRASLGEAPDAARRAGLRLAAIRAAHLGAEVVREAQALVGADALHRGHTIERLVRDTQMLLHHVVCSPSTAEQLGSVLLGTYEGPAGFI